MYTRACQCGGVHLSHLNLKYVTVFKVTVANNDVPPSWQVAIIIKLLLRAR